MAYDSYHKRRIGNRVLRPETQMMGYGYDARLSEGSLKPPVFLTSTFVFRSAQDGKDFFDYTSGRKEIVEWLRQKSRPYLFSNALAPVVAATTIAVVLDLLSATTELRDRLETAARGFRARMTAAGFDIRRGEHPIVPVMLYDEALAHRMAEAMLEEGIYVIGFSYPVVPKGAARIRVQISAAHTDEQIDRAMEVFARMGRRLGVIG